MRALKAFSHSIIFAAVAALAPSAFAAEESSPSPTTSWGSSCAKAAEVLLKSDALAMDKLKSSLPRDKSDRVNDGFLAMSGAMSFADDVLSPASALYQAATSTESQLKPHLDSYFQYLDRECSALAKGYEGLSLRVAQDLGDAPNLPLKKYLMAVQTAAYQSGAPALYPTAYLDGDLMDWANALSLMSVMSKRKPSSPAYERVQESALNVTRQGSGATPLKDAKTEVFSSKQLAAQCLPAAEVYLGALLSVAPTGLSEAEATEYWAGAMTSTVRLWKQLNRSIASAQRLGGTDVIASTCADMAQEAAIANSMRAPALVRDTAGKPSRPLFETAILAADLLRSAATSAPLDFPGFASNSYLTGQWYLPQK